MRRYSLNTLKNSFELGSTSNWVLVFEASGRMSPDASKFNLIDGRFTPAIDVEYDDYTVINQTISVGPGVELTIPVYAKNSPPSVQLSLYDDHTKTIRKELKYWVNDILQINKGRAPDLAKLKESCMLMKVHHFDKLGNSLSTDAFYILPTDSLTFRGDQSFGEDNIPISFNIVGRQ